MLQICRRYFLLLFPLYLFFGIAAPSYATTIVMMSDKSLVLNSRLIVTGTVQNVTSAYSDAERVAWTYIEIECDRVLKGELPGRTIVLKQLGGDFEQFGFHVFGQPQFVAGQRVLLYLNTMPDGTLHVAHNLLGRFGITKDSDGQEFVERDLSDAAVLFNPSQKVSGTSAVAQFVDEDPISRTSIDYTNHAPLIDYFSKIQNTLLENRKVLRDTEAAQI